MPSWAAAVGIAPEVNPLLFNLFSNDYLLNALQERDKL